MRSAAGIYSLLLVLSVFWTRPVAEWLRAEGLLRRTLCVFALGAGIVLWRLARHRLRGFANLDAGRVLILALIGLGYGVGIWGWGAMPEERIHLVHMTVLTFLFWNGNGILKAACLAAGVGIVEEVVQRWVPGRVFDWRDIGLNLYGAALAGFLICALTPTLSRVPREREKDFVPSPAARGRGWSGRNGRGG